MRNEHSTPILLAVILLLTCGGRVAHAAETPHAPAKTHDPSTSRALYRIDNGPHAVQAVERVIVQDQARNIALQLRVTFPAAGGPFPVILWSHGATGTKDDYQPLVRHWVSHGYVCIQVNHSDSRAFATDPGNLPRGPERFRDWANRPKDLVFILDSLDTIEQRVEGVRGKLDRQVIGVGGHSFGAHTAQLIAGVTTRDLQGVHISHADPRPRAFVLISPQGRGQQLDDRSWQQMTRPALSITGSKDWGRNGEEIAWRLDPYTFAPPQDKYLLFIEGAHHGFGGITGSLAYRNAGPANAEHLAWVTSTTMAFWDAYLKQEAAARDFLQSGHIEASSNAEATLSWRARDTQQNEVNHAH